jgi:N-acetylglutamate synthase-like GNAT family acetyltransferase
MTTIEIRPITADDKEWVSDCIKDNWHSDIIVAHGVVFTPADLSGFIATHKKKNAGLLTYHIDKINCEIITLNSFFPSNGVGTALIDAVKAVAQKNSCRRLFVITTNDNIHALGFYQKRGFSLVAVHQNALEQSRKLKPGIPLIGQNNILIRDEIELELKLHP